ncbi:hypothetical protein R6Q59_004860 [Mikania micrantha]
MSRFSRKNNFTLGVSASSTWSGPTPINNSTLLFLKAEIAKSVCNKVKDMKKSFFNRIFFTFLLLISCYSSAMFAESTQDSLLGSARVVFQTNYGDIEFGFYPSVAPQTVEHIYKLVRLGCYNTNHFFRVDKGFVAQVADVAGGRKAPMNEEQRKEAEKTIKGEFSDVKHVRGILSMGRYSDPDSAQSSFSVLLGDAPHLDHEYAIFGKVTKGDETLRKLEELPTRREGIFVMPTERITILSTYCYDTEMETCQQDNTILKRRLATSAVEIERQRMKCFP